METMTAVVLAPERSAESVALASALEAGLGPVRVVRDRAAALSACIDSPRATLVLDLRAGGAGLASEAHELRAALPGVRTVALVDAGLGSPMDCDAVFQEPFYLEDVVRWCTRSAVAPPAEGLVEDLAAGLCHEIGNPLTSLFLQLELLRDDEDSADVQEHLDRIEEAARRIQSVVRDVQSAAERQGAARRPVGLRDLAQRVLQVLDERADGFAPRVRLRLPERQVQVDPELLVPALADLWEYLLRAGDGHEPLHVDAAPRGGRLALRHRALAPRLPADAAGRLFTPLWARQALGVEGLSLTSARAAFVRHRGDLRAFLLPEGALLVEALLPDEAQATFEFPSS